MTKKGHAYTPEATVSYENYVRWCFNQAYPEVLPTDKPLRMDVMIDVPVPTSTSKVKRQKMLSGEILPTKKPDNSNIIKSVEDALNKVAYHDDKQIIRGSHDKQYNEREGVLVTITELL